MKALLEGTLEVTDDIRIVFTGGTTRVYVADTDITRNLSSLSIDVDAPGQATLTLRALVIKPLGELLATQVRS